MLPHSCYFCVIARFVHVQICVCLGMCVLSQEQASLISHKIQKEKISLVLECGAQYTEHIMLLCLWRQINSCIMGHNKAEKHLMCLDHMAKNPARNSPADNLRHAPPRSLHTKTSRIWAHVFKNAM